MYLAKFLFIGAVGGTILGEFGRFPFGSSGGSIYLSDILISLSLLCLFVYCLTVKKRIAIPNKFIFLTLFWLVGALSLLVSLLVFPFQEILKSFLYLIRFIIYSSLIWLVLNLVKNKILLFENIINLYLFTGLVLIFFGFIQLLILPNFDTPVFFLTELGYDPHHLRLSSTFLDPNLLGTYLVLTLCLVMYKLLKTNNYIWLVIALINLVAIILTYSRSAYLMLFCSGITLVILFWNKYTLHQKLSFLTLSVILCTASLVVLPRFYQRMLGGLTVDKTSMERIKSWKNGLEIFKSSPVFGVGFNNIRPAKINFNLLESYSPDGGHSGAGIDSGSIFVLATTGITGLILYLIWWFSVIKNQFNLKRLESKIILAAIIGLIINGQFINSLFFVPIMLWYFPLIGALET